MNSFCIDNNYLNNNELKIILDGNVLPRNHVFEQYHQYQNEELIEVLYQKFNEDFIHHIKGNFNLIILEKNKILVFNDYHAINKFFYTIEANQFMISNSIDAIASKTNAKLNKNYSAIIALFQRPVNGITLYENINYSENATKLKITQTKIEVSKYWCPIQFYKKINLNLYKINDLMEIFDTSIKNYLDYFGKENISCTLTGGRDTRTVLAALLKHQVQPHLFTFGFSDGEDVVVAQKIAQKLNLNFSNYFIENLNPENYATLVKKIFNFKNPFLNLHRAHRLDAIEKEAQKNKPNLVFTGFMGGDYTKGVSFNDYIVTKFMRLFFFDNTISLEKKITQILAEHFIHYDESTLNYLKDVINSLDFLNQETFKENEFLIAFQFIGSLHDSQDIFIFNQYCKMTVAPFMDQDIFESLFHSQYCLFTTNRATKSIVEKLKGGEFQANLITNFYPKLAYIQLANRYRPIDILKNRYLYLIQRIFIELTKTKQNSSTFEYQLWFKKFLITELKNIKPEISKLYQMDELHESLQKNTAKTEGSWHQFSNVLNFNEYAK